MDVPRTSGTAFYCGLRLHCDFEEGLANALFAPLNQGDATREVLEYNEALNDENGRLIGHWLRFRILPSKVWILVWV